MINQNFVFSCNHNRVFIYRVHFLMCAHFSNRLCFASTGKVHLPIVTLLANKLHDEADKFVLMHSTRHRASASGIHQFTIFRPFSQFAKITITSMSMYDMIWWELPNVVAEYEAVLHLLITLGLRGALQQDLWKCEFCWILFYFVWSYLIIFYILSH